jgi:hypothetical protein
VRSYWESSALAGYTFGSSQQNALGREREVVVSIIMKTLSLGWAVLGAKE